MKIRGIKCLASIVSFLLVANQVILPAFAQEPIQMDPMASSTPAISVSEVILDSPNTLPNPYQNIDSPLSKNEEDANSQIDQAKEDHQTAVYQALSNLIRGHLFTCDPAKVTNCRSRDSVQYNSNFDLDDSGAINAIDWNRVRMVRNQPNERIETMLDKVLNEVRNIAYKSEKYILELDSNLDGMIDEVDFEDIQNVLLEGRSNIERRHFGMTSPFENPAVPANAVYWGLEQLDALVGGFSHFEIYRRNPGENDYPLIDRMDYLSNRYVDKNIDPSKAIFDSYDYQIRIVREDGSYLSIDPSIINKVNYGHVELKPENVLVIASSNSDPLKGSASAVLDNGIDPPLDLVDYYMEKRGIPQENLIRLDIVDQLLSSAEYYTLDEFKEKILNPIYEHLVLNGLTDRIYAITTLPGAHAKVYDGPEIPGSYRQTVPIETMIASTLPALLRGEEPNFGLGSNHPTKNVGDVSGLLQTTLGFSRLYAPSAVIHGEQLTRQENLKRIIDQTIEAEQEAAARRIQGIGPDYYVHLIDNGGSLDPIFKGSESYRAGDNLFYSMADYLKEFGYTVYMDEKADNITAQNPISDQLLLDDLQNGSKQLAGIAGWYWPNSARANSVYDYVEGITNFGKGSYVSPLDSYLWSGWEALERDGVVVAANNQFEPYLGGTATLMNAFLMTGTPLAFAAAIAAPIRWAPNIFGDPLYNIGKSILGGIKTITDAVGEMIGTKETIETRGISFEESRDGSDRYYYYGLDVTRNTSGNVLEVNTGAGIEQYLANGEMLYKRDFPISSGLSTQYYYDHLGRIIREEVTKWDSDQGKEGYIPRYSRREFIYDETGKYQGFTIKESEGSSKEFDRFNRLITRNNQGKVIMAESYYCGQSNCNPWNSEPVDIASWTRLYREFYSETDTGYPGRPDRIEDISRLTTSDGESQYKVTRELIDNEEGKLVEMVSHDDQNERISHVIFKNPISDIWSSGEAEVIFSHRDSEIVNFTSMTELMLTLNSKEPYSSLGLSLKIIGDFANEIKVRLFSQQGDSKYIAWLDLDQNGFINSFDWQKMINLFQLSETEFKKVLDLIMSGVRTNTGRRFCTPVEGGFSACDPHFPWFLDVDSKKDMNGDGQLEGNAVIDEVDIKLIEDAFLFGRTDRPVETVIGDPPPTPSTSANYFSPFETETSMITALSSSELRKKKRKSMVPLPKVQETEF